LLSFFSHAHGHLADPTDTLSSIVVTLTVLLLMETLDADKEERQLSLPPLFFTAALGFFFMSYIMINTFLSFHWFRARKNDHKSDLVLHGLTLLFLIFLSFFSFALQSLLQAYIDHSAIYLWGCVFIGIHFSCFLIFIHCVLSTDIGADIGRKSAIKSEIIFFTASIASLATTMVLITFVIREFRALIVQANLCVLIFLHYYTRSDTNLGALLPLGLPQMRIDCYTDGVYAVAVTLFLIELRFPSVVEHESMIFTVHSFTSAALLRLPSCSHQLA